MKTRYTEEQKQEILTLYKDGAGCKEIATKTGFGRKAIFNLIKKEVPDKRGKSEANRIRMGVKIMLDDVFDILTPEALYWIGYLYADGGIEKARPVISLGSVDKEHLEKYSRFFGGDLKVNTFKNTGTGLRGCVAEDMIIHRVAFSNKRLHSRLQELGFTNEKSSFILPHQSLIHSRDFWRGVVDGDGWIGQYKKADCRKLIETIGLSGTELTTIAFIEFINEAGIICNTTPFKSKKGNVWQVELHSTIAKKVMTLLYKDSTVYLDRKYKTYQEIINSVEIAV